MKGRRMMTMRGSIVALALILTTSAAGTVANAAPMQGPDPKLLDELAQDLVRFQEAVRGYRSAANVVIRRAYADKIKAIKEKYEPLITLNEKEERDRRLDAIAMFEAFLRKYPSDRRWTPDAMFRLAELYYEKSADEFLATQEAYQKQLDSPNPPTGEPPKPDYNNTVALYRKLLLDFPNYRLLDAAYYLLGFCLYEMNQEAESRQAMLALTCANRYKPLEPPEQITPATGLTRGPLVDTYKDCTPVKKDSKFLPEAWTRVGELHFDNAELPQAISAYQRVLEFKDSSYYDKALYKLAWSYYRDNRFPDAIREFDRLVKWADDKKTSGDKFGSDLRPEAIQYLAVSFTEPDWDGDTVPDTTTGLSRAQDFYKGRDNEPHVKEVYQRIGELYFDTTRYAEAIAVYKVLLEKWPYYSEAPRIQDQIVSAYEKDRNLVAAAKERELLGRNYAKGTEWYKQNQDNPDALAAAQQLSEDALLTAATNIHVGAQACSQSAKEQNNPAKMAECKPMYATSAELYEKYLAAYPNSKRAYEFSLFYADALFYSEQYNKAIVAYTGVRDSMLDNRHQADAAFQIIKAYEFQIDQAKAAKQLDDPPIPKEDNTKPPVTPIAMPEIYQKYLGAMDWYVNNIKDDKVPDLRYAAAVLQLRYRNWPEARGRLMDITKAYCGTKPQAGFQAYDALIQTYLIDYKVEDPEQKDCALGRLLEIAEQFGESPCSKQPDAGKYTQRFAELKTSIKSSVIAERLKLAMENEAQGTDKQLALCKEGSGGIAIVTGSTPGAAAGGQPGAGGGKKLSTEIDVGLALDLMDLVAQNPKDRDAPSNLNNACVIYERLYQYGEATKCYERLAREYPDSKEGMEGVYNAAKNNERFFNFDQAVAGYVKIAEDPKFANSEHRTESLGLAATLLDNDQQYSRAAAMYKRYADAITNKPNDSAQAFFFSCEAFEKMKDTVKQRNCLTELNKRYASQPEAGTWVVNSYLKLATLAEQSKDPNATRKAYQKVRDEFIARKLPPASPAAAAAAKAEYLLLDDKFNAFKAKQLRLSNSKTANKTLEAFMAEAKSLRDEYGRVFDYKDANWTLAAFLRRGDIFYEFGQKLLKVADNPPDEVKKLEKQACRADPSLCGTVETTFKDEIFKFVTPVEDEAKSQWKTTLDQASKLGVTNEYVKKARENLSKYLPDEFPYIKDERPQMELP